MQRILLIALIVSTVSGCSTIGNREFVDKVFVESERIEKDRKFERKMTGQREPETYSEREKENVNLIFNGFLNALVKSIFGSSDNKKN